MARRGEHLEQMETAAQLEDYENTVTYDQWLKDFKKTPEYRSLVTEPNRSWRKIQDELLAMFNNELLLRTADDVGIPKQQIDVSQRDNYKRQFRAWLAQIKHTCPNQALYFGPSYDSIKYGRYFFKYHWDPEKTVDERMMKRLLGREWDKHYDFDYNAM